MPIPIIEASELTKHYSLKSGAVVRALSSVSFAVEEGDAVGLIGMNGAGKSTMIKLMTGIIHPTSGTVSVMGCVPARDRRSLCRRYGVMFGQRSQMMWDLPARDSFFVNGSIYGLSSKDVLHKLEEFGHILDLDFLDVPVRQLSLGQKMICDFLLILLHEPRLLFLDEATIGLDVYNRARLLQAISYMNRLHGITMVLTTHLMNDIESVCGKILLIDKGELRYDGPLTEFLRGSDLYRKIGVEFHDSSSLDRVSRMLEEHEGIRVAAEERVLKIYCPNDNALIRTLVASIYDTASVAEITIANVSLEERLLQMRS